MIRDVLRMGDPRLFARAREVDDVAHPQIAALLADMRDTMRAAPGVGLAKAHRYLFVAAPERREDR